MKDASIVRRHRSSISPLLDNCSNRVNTLPSLALPKCFASEKEGEDSLHTILAENNMPKELHDSPALRITFLGIYNPVPEMSIIA